MLRGHQLITKKYPNLITKLDYAMSYAHIDEHGNLTVSVYFEMKTNNPNYTLFSCAKLDSKGQAISVNRDIPGSDMGLGQMVPEKQDC